MGSVKYADLIRTIEEDDPSQPGASDESDQEVEYQPSKAKNKKKVDFNPNFKFVSSVAEYNKDTWDDLAKYVKRKVKSKTEDRIKKVREESRMNLKEENDSEEEDDASCDDIHISDDELKHDNIKVKPKKITKKQKLKELEDLDNPVVEYESDYFEEAPPYDENASFYIMNLSRPLLKAISAMNFVHPTPIQSATIPVALLGKDVCGCAATGTGKTAAYMLPTLERLLFKPHTGSPVTRVVVLVPTRELGVQVYQVSRQLAQFTNVEVGLSVGGLDLKVQETVLRKNPDVVIATPGRLIDHLRNTPSFTLHSIEVLILDEADRMLDEYFADQMKEIIRMCSPKRQTMLFSATMTEEVKELAAVSLSKPVKIFVNSNKEVAFNLRQEFIRIRVGREGEREAILAALVCRSFRSQCLIFTGTRSQAHRLHLLLGLLGIQCAELHGALPQPQRLAALQTFKDQQADILIATDVAARGLDISGVKTVINFVMPATVEHYIHRVGRTARAGRAGVSVSLAGEKERKLVKDIVKRAKNPVKARVIPPEIIAKYKAKVDELDPKIEGILQEEYAERMLSRAENQHNRLTKKLTGDDNERDRPWFQTHQERRAEKERLALTANPIANKKDKEPSKPKNDKGAKTPDKNPKKGKMDKNKGKPKKLTPEDRAEAELDKVALYQARLSKRNKKQKRIRTVYDNDDLNQKAKAGLKRKASNFTDDLTDVSRKGAKRMRYDANVRQKEIKTGKVHQRGGKKPNKMAGGNRKGKGIKSPKGKAFGKPQRGKKSTF
ncbi:dead-box helicase Rs1 [Arctopsyche grandis]|uniref:dead-box helicase Rs1 n=1 Tax=Arctopsyche grandis TaxID=121162 RepID=UPI00406D7918